MTNDGEKEFKSAWECANTGNHSEAIKLFQTAADMGHTGAMVELGHYYLDGIHIEKDYEKATFWYSQAAEKGNPQGDSFLGWCYEHGYGVHKALDMALFHYWHATETGEECATASFERLTSDIKVYADNGDVSAIQLLQPYTV